jgi:hypothetical protein
MAYFDYWHGNMAQWFWYGVVSFWSSKFIAGNQFWFGEGFFLDANMRQGGQIFLPNCGSAGDFFPFSVPTIWRR